MRQILRSMILLWLHNHGWHFWEYRNPACRTCSWCHKHQDYWISAWEGTNWMYGNWGNWE